MLIRLSTDFLLNKSKGLDFPHLHSDTEPFQEQQKALVHFNSSNVHEGFFSFKKFRHFLKIALSSGFYQFLTIGFPGLPDADADADAD